MTSPAVANGRIPAPYRRDLSLFQTALLSFCRYDWYQKVQTYKMPQFTQKTGQREKPAQTPHEPVNLRAYTKFGGYEQYIQFGPFL
jgi:hypothetical protein